jgi:hypothetical protein
MYFYCVGISHTGDRKRACRILVGRADGKRPVGRTKCGWEDIIKMGLQEVEWGGMDWITLTQERDRLGGAFECGNEPSGSVKCGEFLD